MGRTPSPRSFRVDLSSSPQLSGRPKIFDFLTLREFSPETLADLREIRNFSQYTDLPGSSKDVQTGIGMSSTQSERFQFEWTENLAYGGI
ncbi:unnamed protein product [Caenorhabditis nigoni]